MCYQNTLWLSIRRGTSEWADAQATQPPRVHMRGLVLAWHWLLRLPIAAHSQIKCTVYQLLAYSMGVVAAPSGQNLAYVGSPSGDPLIKTARLYCTPGGHVVQLLMRPRRGIASIFRDEQLGLGHHTRITQVCLSQGVRLCDHAQPLSRAHDVSDVHNSVLQAARVTGS